MADDRRATVASPGPTGPARPASGYRAMVVEDEPQLAALVASYLGDAAATGTFVRTVRGVGSRMGPGG